jgi:hypothetical protein
VHFELARDPQRRLGEEPPQHLQQVVQRHYCQLVVVLSVRLHFRLLVELVCPTPDDDRWDMLVAVPANSSDIGNGVCAHKGVSLAACAPSWSTVAHFPAPQQEFQRVPQV